jgi:ABC-type proline/glycine betaine transport system ATPase subunit
LDDAFSAAGLPLIRFEMQEVYSVSEIQKALVLCI